MVLAGEGCSPEQLLETFNAGADDCLVAPFWLPEMLARVNALLRRTIEWGEDDILSYGDLELDRAKRRVRRGKRTVLLAIREFTLLEALMERPGHVLSRTQLQQAGWGRQASANERNVDAVIGRLNKKLGSDLRLVQAVRGEGYVLRARQAT